MTEYDFLNNNFYVFEPVSNKDSSVEIEMPLFDLPVILKGYDRILDNGTPIVSREESSSPPKQWVFNNPEYKPIENNDLTIDNLLLTYIPKSQFLLLTMNKLPTGTLEQNKKAAFNYLMNNGIPRASSAGIVGNLYHEDLGNPFRTSKDSKGTTSYGIALFNSKGEQIDLLKWSNENGYGDKPDFYLLLDYLIKCIKDNKYGLSVLLDEKLTPELASFIWGKNFERFGGKTKNKKGLSIGYLYPNDPEHVKRAKTAKLIFDEK